MMKRAVLYTKEAKKDLCSLDVRYVKQVMKAINKISEKPLSQIEGGYGKPLGNHLTSNLSGYLKIKLTKPGLRVVYSTERQEDSMKIIIVSVRTDEEVYKMAYERVRK